MGLVIKLDTYLRKLESAKLVLVLWVLSYIVTLPIRGLQLITKERTLWESFAVGKINLGMLFVIAIFIAPFIETFIYQTIVFGILGKVTFFSSNQVLIILISGVLFSLGHNYSILYTFRGLLTGSVLAYGYSLFKCRKEGPYLMVSAIHALRNFVAVMLFTIIRY